MKLYTTKLVLTFVLLLITAAISLFGWGPRVTRASMSVDGNGLGARIHQARNFFSASAENLRELFAHHGDSLSHQPSLAVSSPTQTELSLRKATNGFDANTAPGPVILVGSTVIWTYLVTNTSGRDVGDILVTDDQGVVVTCPQTTLGPGEFMTCTGSGIAVAGQYVNIGTAKGFPAGSTTPVSATDPSHYFGVNQISITLEKATNGQDADLPPGPIVPVGSTVNWTYLVTNTGAENLTDVTVTDDQGVTVTCPNTTLASGASMTCTASGTAQLGQYANTGTVTASLPSEETVVASDMSHYFGQLLRLEKATNGIDADLPPGPSILVGNPVMWTYVVTNPGPATVSNIIVTDDQGVVVTCPGTTLTAGSSMSCTGTGIATLGQYANLGTVTGQLPSDDILTASDPSHYLGFVPVLSLEKRTNGVDADTVPGPLLNVGDAVTWTYIVTNIGTLNLTNVQVTDDQQGPVTCPQSTLAMNESMTCTLSGTVQVGQYSNLGTASGKLPNNESVFATDPSHYYGVRADLEIVSKTGAPDPVSAGDQLIYTIGFMNNGPTEAQSVVVSDSLPAGTTLVSATAPAGWGRGDMVAVGANGTITFTKASVANAETASFTIVVQVSPGSTGSISNTVTATSATTDPTPDNNSKTAVTTVQARADLEIVSKTDAPDPVVAGNQLTYTIAFISRGPSDAQSVVVSDSLPAGTTLVSATAPAGWGRGDMVAVGANGTITFTKASVANAETASFTIVVQVSPGSTGSISNTVTATSATTDPTPDNNSKTAVTTVQARADLEIVSKTDAPDPVVAGNQLTYTIAFISRGPSDAQSVVVSDSLPAGTTLVAATAPVGWGRGDMVAVGANGTITFTKASVANAETASFTIVVQVSPGSTGSVSNTVTATSATTDPAPDNNSKTAVTTVQAQADLEIASKTDAPDPVVAGNQLTYTIAFISHGPSDAQSVVVSDSLPAGTTLVATTAPAGWGRGDMVAVGANGTIAFTKASVANAETASFTIVVQVSPGSTGSISNTVTATSATTDPAPDNNSKTATTTIACQLITVTAPAVTLGAKDQPFSQMFSQTGGFGTTTFSLAAGALPTGLQLASNGTLTGTPTQLGSFVFTVKATDSKDCMGQTDFTLLITDFTSIITDPLRCTGPGGLVTGTIQLANSAASSQAFTLTTTFSNYVGIPGSCMVSGATGATCVVTASGLTASGNILVSSTLTVQYQAQVADVLPGTALTVSSAATLGGQPVPPNPLVITKTVSCQAVGPGNPFPSTSAVSDQKPGSVLFYNLVSSSATNAAAQNARISLTNISPTFTAYVHLFFVDGSSCSIADSYICLTPNQAATFLHSDVDPGTTGYIVAVATDINGCPINFNYLIGDAYVKLSSGHAANLGAESIAALPGGATVCNPLASEMALRFDGLSYNAVPRVLALNNFASPADGNQSLLVVNRVGGSLLTGAASVGTLFGILYDDAEQALSFNLSGACQLRTNVSSSTIRTTPRIDQFIPPGRTGWLKLYSQNDWGLFGAVLNFNANAGTNAGAFNQGRNLHKLQLSQAAVYTIPIFPPSC